MDVRFKRWLLQGMKHGIDFKNGSLPLLIRLSITTLRVMLVTKVP